MLNVRKCQKTDEKEKEYQLGRERLGLSLEGVLHGDYTNLVWKKDQKTEIVVLSAAPSL